MLYLDVMVTADERRGGRPVSVGGCEHWAGEGARADGAWTIAWALRLGGERGSSREVPRSAQQTSGAAVSCRGWLYEVCVCVCVQCGACGRYTLTHKREKQYAE